MGGRRLKKKDELNYRRGRTWKKCSFCKHYVDQFRVVLTFSKGEDRIEPRCKIMGLNNSIRYRVHPDNICDAYELRR